MLKNNVNNKFKRFIYFWDIHSSEVILEKLKEYDDWKTYFYFLWDFFDRWHFSIEVFFSLKKIVEEGKWAFVFWNHDLWFMFSHLLRNIKNSLQEEITEKWWYSNFLITTNLYWKLLLLNWEETINDIKTFFEEYNWKKKIKYPYTYYNWEPIVLPKEIQSVEDLYVYMINFFVKNWNLALVDNFNNLLVHSWVLIAKHNITNEAKVLYQQYKWEFIWGVDWLLKISKDFKENLNFEALLYYDTWLYKEIYDKSKIFYYKDEKTSSGFNAFNTLEKVDYNLTNWTINSMISFNNELYDFYFDYRNQKMYDKLVEELNNNNLNKLIVWHWFNMVEKENFEEKMRILERLTRLDFSYMKIDKKIKKREHKFLWKITDNDDVNFINLLRETRRTDNSNVWIMIIDKKENWTLNYNYLIGTIE